MLKEFYNLTTVCSLMKYCWIKLSLIVQYSPLLPHIKEFGPCLSSNVADRPFRPAKDRRLGKPLPYQLPNLIWAHLKAKSIFNYISGISYARLLGRFSYITHPFATKQFIITIPFNLHVLSIFLAFILSQDRTHSYFFRKIQFFKTTSRHSC